jgi:hypothetical protein
VLLVRLPIPGQQLGDFVGWIIGQPGQHVRKPCLGIDVVHLAGLCRLPNYAEWFWEGPVICAHLQLIEQSSSRCHSA